MDFFSLSLVMDGGIKLERRLSQRTGNRRMTRLSSSINEGWDGGRFLMIRRKDQARSALLFPPSYHTFLLVLQPSDLISPNRKRLGLHGH